MIRRVMGRTTCRTQPTTRIRSRARIVNTGGSSDLIRIGAYTVIRGELLVFAHGGRIEIGDWCYVGEGTRIWSGARISIGNRVMIAHNVNIFDNQTHPLNSAERHKHFKQISSTGHPNDINLGDRPISIEDDAWISAGAILLRGITVGRGAIVGAGSVVTHSVAPMSTVAGNPARIIHQGSGDAGN